MNHAPSRVHLAMRAGLLLLAACSSAATTIPITQPVAASIDPGVPIATDVLVTAAHARWLGSPDIEPLRRANDVDGLLELGRSELAVNDAAAADRAFAKALAKAETKERGRWVWPAWFFVRAAHFEYTRDGKWLVTGDGEGRVDIWDVASMRVVRSFNTAGYARSFVVSNNGKWLATCLEMTQIWDLETGAAIAELPFNSYVLWSSRDHLIASRDTSFVDYDVETKKETTVATNKIARIAVADSKIFAIDELAAVAYDDEKLVPVGEIKFARQIEQIAQLHGDHFVSITDQALLWHDFAGKVTHEVLGRWYVLATSNDLVAVTTYQGQLEIYKDGKLLRSISAGRNTDELEFHPRGTLLAAGGYEGASLWNVETGEHVHSFVHSPVAATALAFDETGGRLAVGSSVGHTAVWTLATGAVTTMTVRPTDTVEYVAFGHDGNLVVSTVQSNAVGRAGSTITSFDRDGKRLWWQDTDRTMFLGFRPGTHALSTAQFVPKPNGMTGMGVTLWKSDGKLDRTVLVEVNRAFQWSKDGSAFLGTSGNDLISVQVEGNLPATRIDLHQAQAALDPSGTLVAAAADDGKVAIWDLATKTPKRVLFDDTGGAQALAWTPDGKTLATATWDTVTLWNPATGARLAKLVGPTQIRALAIRPDGRILATAHDDGRVILWTIATGAQIATLQSPGELTAFVTTPDGAIDGSLPEEILGWRAGGRVLPARAVFARQHVDKLLATRIAQVPHDVVPRAHLTGAAPPPPPPRCVPEGEANQRTLKSAVVLPDEKHLRVCVEYLQWVRPRVAAKPPAMCFDVDLASGKYAPHAPTPDEAFGTVQPAHRAAWDGNRTVNVCEGNTCREVAIKELDAVRVTVEANAHYLAAAYRLRETDRDAVLVYDLASGKRVSQFISTSEQYAFLDDTLLATNTPSSKMFDVRKGRSIGEVKVNTTATSPTRLAGDVWAFNDWRSGDVVFQNIKTGRVSGRFKMPRHACTNEGTSYVSCEGITLQAAGSNVLVMPSVRPGDVMVLGRDGKVVAEHHLPSCQ